MTFDDFLHRHAGRQPTKHAVRTAERSITYAELEESVSCLAGYLLELGLRRGDRIAIHWSQSVEAVQLLLAAFRAGLIAVPVNLRLKPPEIAYILEHSGSRICFSEPPMAGLAREAQRNDHPEVMSEVPLITNRPISLPEIDPHQPALIVYTSGTTARPKGVIHTHRSLIEGVSLFTPDPIGPDDILLAMTQLAHVSGLHVGVLAAVHQGATIVILKAFEPSAALNAIEKFGCTFAAALPAMLQSMMEEQVRQPRNVSSMRNIVAGGDTVPVVLQQRAKQYFAVEIREVYGMTETVPVTLNPGGGVHAGSIGPAVVDNSIRLLDAQGMEVNPGESGEIVVRSPANCIGYWNDPEATARLFEDGWLRTGDLASRDPDGYYWFQGRLKHLIIRGGSNISPQEVEEALYQHSAVLEAGVIGATDPVYGQVPVAFVVLREGHSLTEQELLVHARRLIADYKAPEHIYFVEELPKGLTGKVDRRSLRDMLIAQTDFLEKPVIARV